MRNRLVASFCLSSLAQAQTYVVDVNGSGTFTDLPTAVAAVPSGATLRVLPGSYAPFTLANKSLTIVGFGASVRMSANVVIGPTTSSDSVRISGLGLRSDLAPAELRILSCAGPVVVDDCFAFTFGNPPLRIDVQGSANVHLLRLGFDTANSGYMVAKPAIGILASTVEIAQSRIFGLAGMTSATPGGTGIDIGQGSFVSLVSCRVAAGRGTSATVVPAGPGGIGVLLAGGSTLHVYGREDDLLPGTISGGTGGYSAFGVGGAGGDGLVVQQGSTAIVHEALLNGGLAGTFNPNNGRPSVVDATSSLVYDPAATTPRAYLDGAVTALSTVRYTLRATPGTPAAMLVSFDFVAQSSPPLGFGLLAVAPTGVLGPFTVPANGKFELPSLVPTGWPLGLILGAQFVTYDATRNRFEVSNAFTAVSQH